MSPDRPRVSPDKSTPSRSLPLFFSPVNRLSGSPTHTHTPSLHSLHELNGLGLRAQSGRRPWRDAGRISWRWTGHSARCVWCVWCDTGCDPQRSHGYGPHQPPLALGRGDASPLWRDCAVVHLAIASGSAAAVCVSDAAATGLRAAAAAATAAAHVSQPAHAAACAPISLGTTAAPAAPV